MILKKAIKSYIEKNLPNQKLIVNTMNIQNLWKLCKILFLVGRITLNIYYSLLKGNEVNVSQVI